MRLTAIACLAAESISGEEKALAIKKLLDFDTDRPLTEQLGSAQLLLICRETSDEFELVVPHALFETPAVVVESSEALLRFAPNEFGVAARITDGVDGAWRRFDDSTIGEWPNQPPSWLLASDEE